MENEIKIAADQAALRYLVTQLYMHKFFQDPAARNAMPAALISTTRRDAQQAREHGGAEARLRAAIHESVENFFTDIDSSLSEMGL